MLVGSMVGKRKGGGNLPCYSDGLMISQDTSRGVPGHQELTEWGLKQYNSQYWNCCKSFRSHPILEGRGDTAENHILVVNSWVSMRVLLDKRYWWCVWEASGSWFAAQIKESIYKRGIWCKGRDHKGWEAKRGCKYVQFLWRGSWEMGLKEGCLRHNKDATGLFTKALAEDFPVLLRKA